MKLCSRRAMRANSRALVNPVVAPSEMGEDLVADRAHAGGEVVDAHAVADQGGKIAAPRDALGEVGDGHSGEVHGNAAGDGTTLARHDHLAGLLALGGGGRSQEAVGTT